MATLRDTVLYGDLTVTGKIEGYVKEGDVSAAIHYVGTVNYKKNLPGGESGQEPATGDHPGPLGDDDIGAVYIVRYKGTSGTTPLNAEFIWSWTNPSQSAKGWEELGNTQALDNYDTKTEVDTKIASAIGFLDYGGASSGYYVTQVTETDGVIAVNREAKGSVANSNTQLVDGGTVYTYVENRVNGLDYPTPPAGDYVTSVTQSNGVISVARKSKGSVASGDKELVDGNAVYTAINGAAGTGLSANGTTLNHSNSITAETTGKGLASNSTGTSVAIPFIKWDAQGHLTTGSGGATFTVQTFKASDGNNGYYSTGLVPSTSGNDANTYLTQGGTWRQVFNVTPTTDSAQVYLAGLNSTTDNGAVKVNSSVYMTGGEVHASKVYNAVWNDLTDRIPVNEECYLEYGKCYCFDGENYYQSEEYLPEGLIGIHSDTGGFELGHKDGVKELQCSVAGFVLAYVDKEYPVGTPLTATEDGYLTEILMEDKIKYPERIVATYWKSEPLKEWGSEDKKVKVNGRKWVKVK